MCVCCRARQFRLRLVLSQWLLAGVGSFHIGFCLAPSFSSPAPCEHTLKLVLKRVSQAFGQHISIPNPEHLLPFTPLDNTQITFLRHSSRVYPASSNGTSSSTHSPTTAHPPIARLGFAATASFTCDIEKRIINHIAGRITRRKSLHILTLQQTAGLNISSSQKKPLDDHIT